MDHCVYDDAPAEETIDKVMLATTSKIDPSMITEKPSSIQAECFTEKKARYQEGFVDEEPSIHYRPPPSTFAACSLFDQPISRQIRLPDLSRGIRVSYCHYVLMTLSILGLFVCLLVLGFLELARGHPTPVVVVTNNIGLGVQSSPLLALNEQSSPAVVVVSPAFSQALQAELAGVLMSTPDVSAIRFETTTTTLVSSEAVLASSSPPVAAPASLGNQTQSSIMAIVSASSTASSSTSQSSSPITETSGNTTLSPSFPVTSIITTTLVTSVIPPLPSRRPIVPLTRSFTGPGIVGQILGGQ